VRLILSLARQWREFVKHPLDSCANEDDVVNRYNTNMISTKLIVWSISRVVSGRNQIIFYLILENRPKKDSVNVMNMSNVWFIDTLKGDLSKEIIR
jgi:hypothetical protein